MREKLSDLYQYIVVTFMYMPLMHVIAISCKVKSFITGEDFEALFDSCTPMFESLSYTLAKGYDKINGNSNSYERNVEDWKEYHLYN